jgi:polyhydroxyalkanoate synthesis regulator phasin
MEKGFAVGFTQEDLANALGITTDQLTTAYQTAYKAALDDAVSKGLITQAQEDQLTASGKAFPFGERWEGWLAQNGIDFNTYLAQALNISVDQLQAAYKTAFDTRVDTAVTNGKLTQEQADLLKGRYALFNDSTFQSSMQSAYKDAVNQAVASGVITQAQADQILSKSSNLFERGLGGFGGFGGFGGGRRGHGGWMGGGLPQAAP